MSILRSLGLISAGPGGGNERDNKTKWLMLLVAGVGLLAYWWWISPPSPSQPTGSGDNSASSQPSDTPNDTDSAASSDPSSPPSEQATSPGILSVRLDELPPEAAQTLALIDEGGPFRYADKDGSTFKNYEGLLPQRERGYYREYTVPTPGESDRGARRIITGDQGEFYWTDDHYATFWRIQR